MFGIAATLHYKFTVVSEHTASSALIHLLLLQAFGILREPSWNGPSWSVSAEWFAYSVVFTPMAFGLRRKSLHSISLVVSASIAVFLTICWMFFHGNTSLIFFGVLRIIPEFLAGYLLYRIVEGRRFHSGVAWLSAGVLLLFVQIFSIFALKALIIPAIACLLLGLYVGGPLIDRLFGNRLMLVIGDASYSIYIIQTLCFTLMSQVTRRLHLAPDFNASFLFILLELVIVLIAGWLCFRYIEEPSRRFLLKHPYVDRKNPEIISRPHGASVRSDTEIASTIG